MKSSAISRWRQLRRSALARDVSLALIAKLVLLAALFALVARPSLRPATGAAAIATAVVGEPASKEASQ